MIKTSISISNKLGLHARASAKLTKLAGSFPCEVWIAKGERRVNAKSIMGVMMLAAGIGSTVEIDTDGEREQEAMDALLALINDKFGEGERHLPSTVSPLPEALPLVGQCWWRRAAWMWPIISSRQATWRPKSTVSGSAAMRSWTRSTGCRRALPTWGPRMRPTN